YEQKILRIADEVHIDKEFRETIDKAVERIRETVMKEPKLESYVRALKGNQNQHAFFTQKINLQSMIAAVLAKQLEWISKTTIDKLVYASVMSDITLAVRPELLKIESLLQFEEVRIQFSEEEQKIWLTHPKDAASLIKRY